MPDLVNDPRYEGIDLIRPEEEANYSPEELKRRRDLWREWADKQRDAAAHLTEQAAMSGMDADTALSKAGFADEKEKGKYIWTLFGNQGLFATQGNVDPNLEYDWNRGVKTWKKGTDNEGQSIPITRDEFDSRRQAQSYQQAGLLGYGAHANAEAFGRAVGYGHFILDPQSGNYFNPGMHPDDPSKWQWVNPQIAKAYNQVHGIATGGNAGSAIPNAPQQPQQQPGGWLPDQGGGGYGGVNMGGAPTAQYGGSGSGLSAGEFGGFAGGVPDMYAGTKAAVGMPQGGGGMSFGGPTRQQQQAIEEEDSKSPYKQLLPPGQQVGQSKQQSGQMGAF